MAAPLNDAEFTALLMASPMYQKLEQIRRNVASGAVSVAKNARKMAPGKYDSLNKMKAKYDLRFGEGQRLPVKWNHAFQNLG